MFGSLQVLKKGMAANAICGPFASGLYQSAGFVADPQSINGIGGFWDALNVVVPGSGELGALRNFSVVASGNISNGAGNWIFNLAICQPLPALTAGVLSFYIYWFASTFLYPKNQPQFLPVPSADTGIVTVSDQTTFSFEADVTVAAGALSGTWFLQLDGVQVASGDLTNLPNNLAAPFAAYLQISSMPSGAAISGVTLGVSVAGYSGAPSVVNL
ncbi:MAG: hypothetical protein ACYDCM_07180 [Candidatus Acidiferrales bacterium]